MANDNGLDHPDGTISVPLHREELRVSTTVVDSGAGVRVHKRVTEREQTIDQPLWHDELDVQRVAVGQMVAPGDLPATRYEGDTLVVPVLEEVLVVEKRYRIKEELHITRVRRQHVHVETVRLKSEELTVERFGDGTPAPANNSAV